MSLTAWLTMTSARHHPGPRGCPGGNAHQLMQPRQQRRRQTDNDTASQAPRKAATAEQG